MRIKIFNSFRLTIAVEDNLYWERWRPRSGFIMPISWKGKRIDIIDGLFESDKAAKLIACKHFDLLYKMYKMNRNI